MSAVLEREQPRTYQDYSAERKAEVLALVEANGGNVQQTSRDTGIPHQTIRVWLETPERFSNLRNEKRSELSQKLKNIAHQCADLLPERLPDASVRDIVGAMGQSIEKFQLLDGLPTSITESVERQELVCILQSALSSGAIEVDGEVVDSIEDNAAQTSSGEAG